MRRRWEPLLDTLVRERYGALVGRATLLVGSRAEAEDLVQDALVATFGARASFRSVAQAEQYVRRAIVSRSVDRGRRRGRERQAVERLGAVTDHEAPADVDPLAADLVRALRTLSERQRACVVLRYLDDVSVRDTAQALGLSEGAVRRYASDGLAALAERLGAPVPPHDPTERLQVLTRQEARDDR